MSNININTIAKHARVSTTTVSNYINGTEKIPISPETRRRISSVMRELDYRPHPGGSLIRRNRQERKRIGFIFGENCMLPVPEIFHVQLIQDLLRELSYAFLRHGFDLEVLNVADENSRSDWNNAFLDIDFVLNYGQFNNLMYDTLSRRNIPVVEIFSLDRFRIVGDADPVPTVDLHTVFWRNDRQIAGIFDRFYQEGARNFLYISSWNVKSNRPDFYGYDAECKMTGFLAALQAHSDARGSVLTPPRPENSDMGYEFKLARDLLSERIEELMNVDAIIAHNDIVAYGAASVLQEHPELKKRAIKLSGEGDFSFLRHWYPAITTSTVDLQQLSARLIELVENIINKKCFKAQKIEIPIVIR